MAGETNHEVGRAYALVLIGCLENTVQYFNQLFDVYTSPDKLTFSEVPGVDFSFDGSGVYRHPSHRCEVFVECKGYGKGDGLTGAYREFLAKAYVASTIYQRHRSDYFWFVTNVPFGSSFGIDLTSPDFIYSALTEGNEKVKLVLGGLPVDWGHVTLLSELVSVGIFTDSFIRRMGISYLVQPGENLYRIMKLIHANRKFTFFDEIASLVGSLNGGVDPDFVKDGQRLRLPWYGIPRDVVVSASAPSTTQDLLQD